MYKGLIILVVLVVSSCGLIDPNIADFDLNLPKREFTVDTAQWKLPGDRSDVPPVACVAEAPEFCASAMSALGFCKDGSCTADCDGQNCQIHVRVSLSHEFDLARESPELGTIDNQSRISVTVKEVAFAVTENSLNVPTPPFNLWLAPQGVLTVPDEKARLVGRIESIAAKETRAGNVDMGSDGRRHLEEFMANYDTRFTAIVEGTVDVKAGTPLPTGKLVGAVQVTAKASAF
jgi:hypothetical protein